MSSAAAETPDFYVRGSVPSPREARLGQIGSPTAPSGPDEPAQVGAVDEPRIGAAENLRLALRELNPRAVVGAHPVAPLLVFGALGVASAVFQQGQILFVPNLLGLVGGASSVGLIVAISYALQFGGQIGGPGLGFLADRLIRVYFTRIGSSLGVVGMVLIGMITGAGSYLVALGILILGGAVSGAATPSLLGDYYPVDVRIRASLFNVKLTQAAAIVGQPIAAVIAVQLGWQWTLIVFGGVAAVAAAGAFALREPVRGIQDRLAAGADLQTASREDRAAPSFSEAWRTLGGIRSLRRLWLAYPFIIMLPTVVIQMGTYYALTWHVSATDRSHIAALAGVFGLVGAIALGGLQARMSLFRPGRLMNLAALLMAISAALFAAIYFSPFLWLSIILNLALAFCAVSVPAMALSMTTIVVPARVRAMGAESLVLALLPLGLYIYAATSTAAGLGFGGDAGKVLLVAGFPMVLMGAYFIRGAAGLIDGDLRSAIAVSMADEESRRSRTSGRNKMVIARDLDVIYDGAQVVFNVDFDVYEGECIALLGTNGAGKSTLLRAISGIQPAARGAIFLDGVDITHVPPHLNAAKGIVMVPGGHAVFPSLTVDANLRTAAWMYRRDDTYVRARVEQVLGYFPILRSRSHMIAGDLSGGEQQMLALGQAFLMKPRLLMIDELSLGLAPQVVEQLLEIVRRINEAGTTVILVEQSVNVALAIARRAVFMEKGEIRYDGPTSELVGQGDIVRSVFLGESRRGGPAIASRRSQAVPGGAGEREVVLAVDAVRVAFGGVRALNGATIQLISGEVVGIVGSNGAGKTTLFDVISGFVKPDAGAIHLLGQDITRMSPDGRSRLGLGRSFQSVNLFAGMTVRESIAVAMENHLESRSAIMAILRLPNYRRAERRAMRRVDGLIESLGLDEYADRFLNQLSTGTRRIVDIACILASRPRVLLLDEPSSGLAQAETEELGPFIGRISRELDCAVLVIEHDLALVAAVSDRMIAMQLGQVLKEGLPSDVMSDPAVIEALIGNSTVAIARSGELTPEALGKVGSGIINS